MAKRLILALAIMVVAGACVVGAGMAGASDSAGFEPVGEAACPVAGCTLEGVCHDYAAVPEPDGACELVCPEVGCASVECHAWDQLAGGGYRGASDMSLNVWIVLPVVLVLAMMLVVRKVGGRPEPGSSRVGQA